MSDDRDSVPDHPDWFGAGDADGPTGRPDAGYDPAGADWFDDVEHADASPRVTPRSGSSSASGSAAGADATAAAGTGDDARARAEGRSAANTGAGAGTEERTRTDRGRQREPRRTDDTGDTGGGFIAWLKRLLGLN